MVCKATEWYNENKIYVSFLKFVSENRTKLWLRQSF